MSLKFIMTFGNVIPERNVNVTLKICLFSNMVLTYKQWQLGVEEAQGDLGDEGRQETCLETT